MRDVVRQVFYLLTWREKRNGVLLFIMMSLGAVLEVVGVGAIPAFVGVVSAPEKLLEYRVVREVYRWLGVTEPRAMVMWAAIGLVLVFVFKNSYLTALAYVRSRYTTARQATISNRLFRAYLRSDYTFHLSRNTAELLRNTNTEAQAITGGVFMPLIRLVMEGMVMMFIFVLLFAVEPAVTIVAFSVLGSITYAFWRVTRSKIDEYAKEEQRHRKQSMQTVNQGLGGFKDARVLGREGFFLNTYQESEWYKAKAARFKEVISALPRLFLETVAVMGILGVAAVLIAQGRSLNSLIPTLTLLGVSVVRLMPSFTKIANDITSLKWGSRALGVVYDDLLHLEAEEQRTRERRGSSGEEGLALTREIHLDGLSYRYPGAGEYALRDVSLTIPRYTSVGFVGPSGAGKTTVVDVILGLLTPTGGRVLVDGVNIQERLDHWQRQIGYIPQSIYLTDDTVRRNVAFGMQDDDIVDEAVWEALAAAQLTELVESFEEGLDTFVGERGIRLSGGQRQRIGIARALYHKPEVLVMDEATSALDNETERNIVEALGGLQGKHTMIVIAHRLSTVKDCDTLFMLDEGRLVAEGTYNHLLATSSDFRRMAGASAEMATVS